MKQDVLLRIIEIINRHGAEIAFPISTVHIERGILAAGGTAESDTRGSEKQPPDGQ